MLAQVRSCAVTQRTQAPCSVSTTCQQQDRIMLRSVIFWSTFLTLDGVLVNIIHYIVFNSYMYFCGNILKQKFLWWRNVNVNVNEKCECKEEAKVFLLFLFLQVSTGEYFIKHTARAPQRISQLSQWETVMSKSFFPSLTCLAYQGLGPWGAKRNGEGLGSVFVSHQQLTTTGPGEKNSLAVSTPCSVLVQDQVRRHSYHQDPCTHL